MALNNAASASTRRGASWTLDSAVDWKKRLFVRFAAVIWMIPRIAYETLFRFTLEVVSIELCAALVTRL